ncbi:MAG: PIN domain-containing protein [Actinobacteria bacterium]|nr:PIN domain-containing protein [Actinomycetota bacterium]
MLLLDNSAWSRVVAGKLPREAADAVASRLEAKELVTCLPFLLEAGYSAITATDRRAMMEDFDRLYQRVEFTVGIEELAVRAQDELTAHGHHRLSPIDLMIAACAHEAGIGVLHYDRDYDRILELTSLSFDSVWVAPAGSL